MIELPEVRISLNFRQFLRLRFGGKYFKSVYFQYKVETLSPSVLLVASVNSKCSKLLIKHIKNVDASDAIITGKTVKSLHILFSSSKKPFL